jgi:hypothetical protein
MKTYTYTVYSAVLKKSFTNTGEFKSDSDFKLFATAMYSGNWNLVSVK